jgi:hypothetical protein
MVAFGIDIDEVGLQFGLLQSKIRQHPHAGANFQHFCVSVMVPQAVHYFGSDVFIGQKMLTQVFFGGYKRHTTKNGFF